MEMVVICTVNQKQILMVCVQQEPMDRVIMAQELLIEPYYVMRDWRLDLVLLLELPMRVEPGRDNASEHEQAIPMLNVQHIEEAVVMA